MSLIVHLFANLHTHTHIHTYLYMFTHIGYSLSTHFSESTSEMQVESYIEINLASAHDRADRGIKRGCEREYLTTLCLSVAIFGSRRHSSEL